MKNSEGSSRYLRPRAGQSLVEFALLVPILLLLIFGLIEFASAIDTVHSMSSLTREGANLAARGTSLDTVAELVLSNGAEIQLQRRGGVVASEVRITDGVPLVTAQAHSTGFVGTSQIGAVGDTAGAIASLGLLDDQKHYVVEIFYRAENLTPVHRLLGFGIPEVMYDRAVF